jgi:hypothetical protein
MLKEAITMMNIISSIVNSGNVMESGITKDTSVKKDSFRITLQEQIGKIKKVSETSSLKPYDRNESKDEEVYKQATKKLTINDSTRIMTVMRSAAVMNPISLYTTVNDNEKIINLVKIKNAYHI